MEAPKLTWRQRELIRLPFLLVLFIQIGGGIVILRFYPNAAIHLGAIPVQIAVDLCMLATIIAPIVIIRRKERALQRRANNQCVACGYDLRATPDRCPECGTIPVKKEIISN